MGVAQSSASIPTANEALRRTDLINCAKDNDRLRRCSIKIAKSIDNGHTFAHCPLLISESSREHLHRLGYSLQDEEYEWGLDYTRVSWQQPIANE